MPTCATGRRPFTDGLGLEDIGVKLDKRKRIEVTQCHQQPSPVPWIAQDGLNTQFHLLGVLHHCLNACPHVAQLAKSFVVGPSFPSSGSVSAWVTAPRALAQVDNHFKTSVEGVYAIGDCIPGPMLAHKAEEDGYVLAEMLAGKPGHVDYNHVPSIVYTDPEVRPARRV